MLWFTINRYITTCNENINVGIVYIPPHNSKYAVEEPYIELQHDLERYCQNPNHVILIGDFNSRTGVKGDYISVDHYFTEEYGLKSIEDESSAVLSNFYTNNISLSRKNKDLTINTHGNQMLDFCKKNEYFHFKWKIK